LRKIQIDGQVRWERTRRPDRFSRTTADGRCGETVGETGENDSRMGYVAFKNAVDQGTCGPTFGSLQVASPGAGKGVELRLADFSRDAPLGSDPGALFGRKGGRDKACLIELQETFGDLLDAQGDPERHGPPWSQASVRKANRVSCRTRDWGEGIRSFDGQRRKKRA